LAHVLCLTLLLHVRLPHPPHRNKECLSLVCDEVPLFWGRSPVDMYRDFMDDPPPPGLKFETHHKPTHSQT
jgi:hypothetical protein